MAFSLPSKVRAQAARASKVCGEAMAFLAARRDFEAVVCAGPRSCLALRLSFLREVGST